MRIYVASSWRNHYQQDVVERLRRCKHEVYDFRHPAPLNHGFSWSEVNAAPQPWTVAQYQEALGHPLAIDGFRRDRAALDACDACVLVLPAGRSAHLEAGYAAGRGKTLIVLTHDYEEPELMALLGDGVYALDAPHRWLEALRDERMRTAPEAAAV